MSSRKKLDGEFFKDIAENASDIIQCLDARGHFVFVNAAWKDALGYADPEIEKLRLWDIIHPDFKDHCREVFNQDFSGTPPDAIEAVFLGKNGRTVHVEGRVSCRFDDAGHVVETRGIFRDISERKQTEERFRQIHETYLGIFNSLTEAIYIQDEKGTFLEVNKGAEDFYGLTREELVGRDPSAVTAPGMNDLEAVSKSIEKTFQTGTPSRFEFWAVRKDGSIFPKDVIVNKGRYFGKDVVIATARDITARKQAEDKLMRQSQLQNMLMEISATYINIPPAEVESVIESSLGRLAEVVEADRAYVFSYNFSRNTCSNTHEWCAEGIRPQKDALQDLSLDPIHEWTRSHRRGEAVHVPDVRILPKGALWEILEPQDIKSLLTVPMMFQGECIGFVGFDSVRRLHQNAEDEVRLLTVFAQLLANIQERKRSEDALRESEELQRKLLQTVPDLIVKTDIDGNITFVNERASTVRPGLNRENIIGKKILAFVEKSDLPRAMENTRLMFESPLGPKEYRLDFGDGSFMDAEVNGDILHDREGRPVGMVYAIRDITERKRNEQTLREALGEKDIMLREIHHRVKNNMQVISSLLRLQTWSISDPAILDILDAAQKRIRSIAFVHEKLYQSKNFSRIDFSEYLQDLLSRLRYITGAASADIAFDIAIRNVELDINRAIPCGLIVNELVSNTLKHAFPEGGPGQIRLTMEEGSDKRICLSVSDNGIGLPESVNIRKPGTLGLQIVSDLVKQLDGTMDIDRRKGTTVTIRF